MDLGIRDWLMVIGVLLLLAVALDGYRRARRERQNQVRLSRNAKRSAKNFKYESQNSEILNGGAKNVTDSKQDAEKECSDDISAIRHHEKSRDQDETYTIDPLFADPFEHNVPTFGSGADIGTAERITPNTDDSEKGSIRETNRSEAQDAKAPEEIILLNILAPSQQVLDADKLKKILFACDCRYQDSGIFYRFEKENGQGGVQFSIVNMIEPGTFSNENLQGLQTPGVSFLLCLPGPQNSAEALNCMIETAQCVARNLNAAIKDENLSSVTDQRLEHHRQQVSDFLKRKLLTADT